MASFIGNLEMAMAYAGNTPLSKIFAGELLIWPSSSSSYPIGQISPEPYGPEPTYNLPDAGLFGPSNTSAYSIEIANDGSIYVAGQFTTLDGNTQNRLVKLTPEGDIDTNFNIGLGANNIIRKVFIGQASGDIYITGSFTSYNGNTAYCNARLDPTTGAFIRTYDIQGSTVSYQAKELADGRVFVSGNSNRNRMFLADGTLDTSFTFTNIGTSDICYLFHQFPDGKFIWSGSSTGSKFRILNADGSIDQTATDNLGAPTGQANDYVEMSDGRIIAVGTFQGYGGMGGFPIRLGAIKFGSDGVYDLSFAQNMINVISNTAGGIFWANEEKTILGSAGAYSGGRGYPYYPRTTDYVFFGVEGGQVYTDNWWEFSLFLWASRGLTGGGFLTAGSLGGTLNYQPITENLHAVVPNETSYNSTTTSLDTLFGGIVGTVYTIEKYGYDQFIIGGDLQEYNGVTITSNLIRINADGTLDYEFKPTNVNSPVRKAKWLFKSDTLLVAGDFGFKAYNGDGSENSDWVATFDGAVKSFALDVYTETVYICGGFTKGIRKFSWRGVEDLTFYSNLGTGFSGGDVNDCCYLMGSSSSTRVYCIGAFTSQNGTSVGGFGVVETTGTPYLGFNYTGFTGEPLWMFPNLYGSEFFVGGTITSIAGKSTDNFGVIQIDGSSDWYPGDGADDAWTRSGAFGGPTYGMVMLNWPLNTSTFNLRYFVYGDFDTYKIGEPGYGMKIVECNNIAFIGDGYWDIPTEYPEGLGVSGAVYAGLPQADWTGNSGPASYNVMFGGAFNTFGTETVGNIFQMGVTGGIIAI